MSHKEECRLILIGKSGVGKSSLGNTLIGKQHFKVSASSSNVTQTCDTAHLQSKSGRILKIIDTPGIFDTKGESMLDEIKSCLQFLSPGPHAIIIVLMPNRVTKEDDKVVNKILEFFGDYHFLKKTILVMNRKTELTDKSEFIVNTSTNGLSKLYGGCEKRFVVVENEQVWEKRVADADEVFKEIDKLEGYYDLEYLSLVHERNKLMKENDELKVSCENVGKGKHEEKQEKKEDNTESFCVLS